MSAFICLLGWSSSISFVTTCLYQAYFQLFLASRPGCAQDVCIIVGTSFQTLAKVSNYPSIVHHCHSMLLFGGSRSTVLARWTAGQQVVWLILNLGHASFQNHLIRPSCPCLGCALNTIRLFFHSFIHSLLSTIYGQFEENHSLLIVIQVG